MRRASAAALAALLLGCAGADSRAAEPMPAVQCMTADGRCRARSRREEDPRTLERAHAEATDRATRAQICADARRELAEELARLPRDCRGDGDCITLDVLECGGASRYDAPTERIEDRWRAYERVCGHDDYRCAGVETSCEAGRCERGLGLVRP